MVKELIQKLEQERISGKIQGIWFMRGVKKINHLQFADDTLFLVVTTTIIVRRFKAILAIFFNSLGGE
jgi:hypothetical protein